MRSYIDLGCAKQNGELKSARNQISDFTDDKLRQVVI